MTIGRLIYMEDNVPASGADKYHGAVASGYDAKREQAPKWLAEQAIIEDMLIDLPAGSIVLDCPIGTGRFVHFYRQNGFIVCGVDKSADMLAQAEARITVNDPMSFTQGDVRALQFADKSVDAAVMCRLTRWLSPEDCTKAINELARVTRKRIIFTARVRNHPHARPYELFHVEGWCIARDEEADGPDYRVIALAPDAPRLP